MHESVNPDCKVGRILRSTEEGTLLQALLLRNQLVPSGSVRITAGRQSHPDDSGKSYMVPPYLQAFLISSIYFQIGRSQITHCDC